MATAKLKPAPVDESVETVPSDEPGFLEKAKRLVLDHPIIAGGLTYGPVGAVAGAEADLLSKAKEGLSARDVASQQTAAEREQLDRSTKPQTELPAWAVNPTEERVVGYTQGGMVPNAAQQGLEVAGKEFPDEYLQHKNEQYQYELEGAHLGAQAKNKEQTDLYNLAKGVEADKNDYLTRERDAAVRLASDQTNAQIRIEQARAHLAQYGSAPDATIAGAFKRAGGFEKATALIGYIMGGVSAAGFSAINHQPNANPFIAAFNSEAAKVVDQFGKNRQAAKEEVQGEQEGFDAITRAFGDQRAARQFVMAGVMDLYKSRIEEIAAQFGIDKNRADYKQLIAKIEGDAAEPYAAMAKTVQESSQQSQKYVPPQAIKATVPTSAVLDPKLAEDGLALQNEMARYGAAEQMPPELQQRVADYARRLAAMKQATYGVAKQRIMGSQGEDVDKQLEKYQEAREKMKLDQLDTVSQAIDRVDRVMATGKGTGYLNQYANLVAQGAISGDNAPLQSFLSQSLASDPEVAQALADVAAEYTRAQTGTAQTKQEIGKVLTAMGRGDRAGVHQFAQQIKQRVRNGESQLTGAFGEKVPQIYHARRQILQDAEAPLPFEGLRMSQ